MHTVGLTKVLLTLVICCLFALPCFSKDFSQTLSTDKIISGRVTDQQHNALSHIKVTLADLSNNKIMSNTTDSGGEFEFTHPDGHICSLSIEPKFKSGFASAYIEDIPGNEPRQFSIQLKPGQQISGRIIAYGKGLKGLTVKVVPNQADGHKSAHGGGLCTTDGDGHFQLLLTPGPKLFIVKNDSFSQLPAKKVFPIEITGAQELSDFKLAGE